VAFLLRHQSHWIGASVGLNHDSVDISSIRDFDGSPVILKAVADMKILS
jgi:hypothetical protein